MVDLHTVSVKSEPTDKQIIHCGPKLIYQTLPVDIGVFPPLISLSVFPVAILTRVWVMPCASMVLVREASGYQNGFIFGKVLNGV